MIKVGVVGGTGYTGVELLRLLAQHPEVEIKAITSRGDAGVPVADMFPSLRRRVDLRFVDPQSANLAACDVVFFATPNGIAMQQAADLVAAGVKVIDLAADFRISDIAEWEKWYGMKHACPELVAEAVYGLPEVNRAAIKSARIVANPGCYPTAVQLGFLPLVEAGVIELDGLIADSKSGVSGAGRKAETHILFAESADNFQAYGVAGHRHLPEIRQGLSRFAGAPVGLTFVPHLTTLIRPDLCAPPDAPDSRNSCDALRTSQERCRLAGPFRRALCGRGLCGCHAQGFAPVHALCSLGKHVSHCRSSTARGRRGGGAVGHRQPGQGSGGAGGTKHEHSV